MHEKEQQKLIPSFCKKSKKNNEATDMIGSGEHATFRTVKKGERILIGSGEHSCPIRAGITPEEYRRELADRLDDTMYSKPIAFVKKLQRRLKK